MPGSFKSTIALATCLIACATAQAAETLWEFAAGSGSLTFSQGALDSLNATGAFILTDGPGNKASYFDDEGGINLVFTSGTVEGTVIQSLTSTGATIALERTTTRQGKTWSDDLITLSDLVLDLRTQTLSAHVKGEDLLHQVVTDHGFRPLFTAASLVGNQITEGSSLIRGIASVHSVGKLSINTDTADIFLNILKLPATGAVADLVKTSDWGVASASVDVVPAAVPEPAACLSALAGLAMMGVARARRRAPIGSGFTRDIKE